MYVVSKQSHGLGEFGQTGMTGSDVTAVVAAIGNTIVGTVKAITGAEVMKRQSKDQRQVAITVAVENTKKLQIQTTGVVEQSRIEVQKVKATYGSITQLILGGGAVFAAIMLTGAFAYSLVSGDEGEYEYEYEYAK